MKVGGKGLLMLLGKGKPEKDEDDEETDSEEESDDEAEAHGRAILDAIKGDDPKALVKALRDCFESYDAEE